MRMFASAALVICLGWAQAAQAVTCTPTGFFRDSINLTAALINPPGIVKGEVDGTGCNIVVYYGPGSFGTVYGANIHGANYFGVVNDGGYVTVAYNTISDIGEKPLNGAQHGVAVYFNFNSPSRGSVYNNTVWNYQKGGIVINGSSSTVLVANNTVIGQNPVNYIAQNGIQIGFGGKGFVTGNIVSGNSYTGAGQTASGGILVVGGLCYGPGLPLTINVKVEGNKLVGNDVGVWLTNLDAVSCLPSATLTRNVVDKNDITSNQIANTSGNGGTQGYQAGVSVQGNGDTVMRNDVCGTGYIGPITPTAAIYNIDVTFTNNPIVKKNTICKGPDPVPSTLAFARPDAYK